MYSNLITPPDFVKEDNETVTIINASTDDIEVLANFCKTADKSYNIYLYKSEMQNSNWLNEAISLSKHIIVNDIDTELQYLINNNKTFYYGNTTYLTHATKINYILDYFQLNT